MILKNIPSFIVLNEVRRKSSIRDKNGMWMFEYTTESLSSFYISIYVSLSIYVYV